MGMKVDFKNMQKRLDAHLNYLKDYKQVAEHTSNTVGLDILRSSEKNDIIQELFNMWDLLQTFAILEESENK